MPYCPGTQSWKVQWRGGHSPAVLKNTASVTKAFFESLNFSGNMDVNCYIPIEISRKTDKILF